MRYGYFDDQGREYVIERPDTPASWVNYLGTATYCAIISNNASGYGFHESPKSGRLLRFRFNSVPTDRPGRYVYLRDADDGDYWSVSWQPVAKPIDEFTSTCAHGLGYTRIESEYKGIRARARFLVPLDEPIEIWEVELCNESNVRRRLDVFGYAEWCFWEIQQDAFNFQYILYTCRMGYRDSIVDYSIRLWPFREPKGFFASTLPVASFDTDRDRFIGLYRHEGNPRSVEAGRCDDSIAIGGTPCGALHSEVVLEPGQTLRFAYILGIGDAEGFGRECRAKYSDLGNVERELSRLRDYWEARLAAYRVNTPDSQLNSMVNLWNQVQCHTTFNWSRSASFNEAGGRDGMGFRDSNQDTLGVVHCLAGPVKDKLVDLLKAQFSSGAAMHGVQPLGFKQGPHNRQGEVFSDDHLWLLISIPAYLKETADFEFLRQVVPYADAGEASVYEHLKRALDFSWSQRGPHGLCLGLAADWNDCLNLKGSGETSFSTFLFLKGLNEFLVLAERLGERADHQHYSGLKQELRAAIDRHVWDGRWFLRGFLDSGRKLGAASSDQSKIFLNSQTWAVLAGAAERDKLLLAMDSVHEYLVTEHGAVLNYPAYTDHDAEVGAITCFPKGLKENAGIFCHANTWAVVAEAMLGRGDHAYKLYRSFLPAAKNESAEHYGMEPYVYSQFIVGKEHPSQFGKAKNSWLTGTATWSFVAVSQYMLGVRADYDGLIVDPSIPADWPGFEVVRTFRGATYRIKVENPERVCSGVKELRVNGSPTAGNSIPAHPAGSEVAVHVVLGRAG